MPTLDEIAAFAEETVRKSDLDTLSVKAIIKLIAEKLGAEKGRDYEKSWLTGQIDRVLSLVRAEAAAAAAAPPPAPAPPPEPAPAPAPEPAAPPKPKGPIVMTCAHKPGTPVWAKMEGFPYWPGRVEKPKARLVTDDDRKLLAAGHAFVRFFGTNDFAVCKHVVAWEEGKGKKHDQGKSVMKRDMDGFKTAVKEAEEFVANPPPEAEEEEEEEEEEARRRTRTRRRRATTARRAPPTRTARRRRARPRPSRGGASAAVRTAPTTRVRTSRRRRRPTARRRRRTARRS